MDEKRTIFNILEMIRGAGAKGEVFLFNSRGVKVTIHDGGREDLEFLEDLGIAIRVIKMKRMGFSFTSDLGDKGLSGAVKEALDNSKYGFSSPANRFPMPSAIIPWVFCYDPIQKNVSLREKIELARSMQEFAKGYDRRIVAVSETTYRDKISLVSIANTNGLRISFSSSWCLGDIEVIATDGSGSSSGRESDSAFSASGLSPRMIGEGAASRAISKLGAKTFRTGKFDLVLDAEITAGLLGAFAPAFFTDNVAKGKSLFRGKLLQKVASSNVTLIDDGLLAGGLMSRPFDGEGVAHRKTVLINRGSLAGFLNDFHTAIETGAESTGNSQRFSYNEAPAIGPTNLYLAPGKISKKKLLGMVKRGLYIDYALGLHTINPSSGEFSIGASGIVIEDGQLAYPVGGIAIAGNMKDLLNSVAEVANDLRFFSEGVGGCAVLLKDMSVSGM